MRIDPNAWLLTLPVALALVQLALQPSTHVLKRLLREAVRVEASAWMQITGGDDERWMRISSAGQRFAIVVAIVLLLVASMASLAAFLGLLPAS